MEDTFATLRSNDPEQYQSIVEPYLTAWKKQYGRRVPQKAFNEFQRRVNKELSDLGQKRQKLFDDATKAGKTLELSGLRERMEETKAMREALGDHYHPDLAALKLALGIGIIGIVALGGVFWGWLSEKTGRAAAYALLFAIQAGVALFLPDRPELLIAAIAAVGTCYTGMFNVVLLSATDFFGTKSLGALYGCILTAWAASPLVTESNLRAVLIAALCIPAIAANVPLFATRLKRRLA